MRVMTSRITMRRSGARVSPAESQVRQRLPPATSSGRASKSRAFCGSSESMRRRQMEVLPSRSFTRAMGRSRRVTKISERSEEHTSELQSRGHLVCRLLLEKKKDDTADKRARDTA